MASKYTPGPWRMGPHGRIETLPNKSGSTTCVVVESSIGISDNARLIASAPELLGACCGFIDAIEGYERRTGITQFHPCVEQVRAAIAKATGEDLTEEPGPDTCAECEALAVGYSEGTPYCAAHYQTRPSITDVIAKASSKATGA